jgi:hypothetical protein
MKKLRFAALLVFAFLSACSDYHYKNYQGDWAPEKLKPYDMSNNAPDAARVYFDTVRLRMLGVPFHRLMLATAVDGKQIEGAGRRSILDVSGEQALKLSPGKHSLRWCLVSMNAMGTGGALCDFAANGLNFEAGKRYVVTFHDTEKVKGTPGNYVQESTFSSTIKNLDTQEVIFPVQD